MLFSIALGTFLKELYLHTLYTDKGTRTHVFNFCVYQYFSLTCVNFLMIELVYTSAKIT